MSSSDYDTYGKLHSKSIFLSEAGVRIHKDDDDSKTVTLTATPTEAGNIALTLPVGAAGALLSDQSTLDARNLHHTNLLPGATPVDADKFSFVDADDSEALKTCTGSQLKTYIGTVSLSAGDIDNSNLFAAGVVDTAAVADNAVTNAKLGADCVTSAELADDSVVTAALAADSVTNAKLGADCVTSAELADDCVTGDHIANGAINAPTMLAVNVVSTAAIGANQVTTANVANDAITSAKVADDAITSAKLAAAVALDTSVQAPIMYFGTNQWRMQLDTGSLVMQKWDGSAWQTHHTFDDGA